MKQVIITGCLGDIGRATALLFIKNGWTVTGLGTRETPADLDSIFSGQLTYVRGSVADGSARDMLIAAALQKGQIDALVNVAGVAPLVRTDLLEMTEESYDRVMGINTKGLLFLTQAVARHMTENPTVNGTRGAICNISSMSAYTSSTSRGEYCISKAGVSMITALFADRLAEYGIPVNEVRPGIIMTGMTETVRNKYDKLIEGGLLPIARWGQPEDVAAAVWALVSGALPYVTGQSLDVDGGFHLRRL